MSESSSNSGQSGNEQRLAKLQALLRGLEEDGYPPSATANLKAQIAALKGDNSPSPSKPSAESSGLVRPWTPGAGSPTPMPPPPPSSPTIIGGSRVSGMNELRAKTERGYVTPPPPATAASEGMLDDLRARVNRWSPERAAEDKKQRAAARQARTKAEAAERKRQGLRLAQQQRDTIATFARDALVAAIKRGNENLKTNTDELFRWSGKQRRKSIFASTAAAIVDVQQKLEEAKLCAAATGELIVEARTLLASLEQVQASRKDNVE